MQHHAKDVLIAYANDTTVKVQYWSEIREEWIDAYSPSFHPSMKWRIKPKPVKAYVFMVDYGHGFESLSSYKKEKLEYNLKTCREKGYECTPIKEVVFD